MGKTKIVLDTNILISALGWPGKPRQIFNMTLEGDVELLISQKQIDELQRVLNYPRLGFTENQKTRFLFILLETATLVETSNKLKIVKDDPDDDVILESAVENNADFLVTGDPHLLKINEFNKVKILTAAQFLKQT